jgi:hypothetical protein
MTHLILHKVRGEPAFDVAEEIEPDMWIIPTSGHRAYPYVKWSLSELVPPGAIDRENLRYAIPPDWPDHYQVTKAPVQEINIGQLISGLVKFKRRF